MDALASSQTPVVSIVSKDVVAVIRMEESAVSSVKMGQSVSLVAPSLPGQMVTIKVSAIAPAADDRAHTFLIQLSPDGPSALRPGSSGTAVVVTSHENVVLVPRESVFRRAGQSQEYVAILVDGKANVRQVQTGLVDNKNAEIVSGLKAGEQVITSGQASVNDGDVVTVATASS